MHSLLFAIGPLIAAPPELDPATYGLELSDELKLLRVLTGNEGDHFGDKLFVLPDGDGDDVADVAIVSKPWIHGMTTGIGKVSVRSGRTLAERFPILGEEHEDLTFGGIARDPLGQVIAVGPDENDDGVHDLQLLGGDGFASLHYLRVVSGADGAVLRQEPPQLKYLTVESRPFGDVLVRYRALGLDRRPSSDWWPPTTGLAVYTRRGVDLDMDGHNDPIRVHRAEVAPERDGLQALDLFVADGRAEGLRWQCRMEVTESYLVRFVGDLGDLNGDGVVDLGMRTVHGDRGTLTIRSGKDGSVLATASAPERSSFGTSVVSLGDVRGDGSRVILVGDPENAGTGDLAGAVFALALRLPPR